MTSPTEPRALAALNAQTITSFHDRTVADRAWVQRGDMLDDDGVWEFIALNHRYNNLLWDEEDLARRRDVGDSEIAANKRAIDGFNQKRNDAVEKIDETILSRLPQQPHADAFLSSETAGAMIDRLSILSLKIFHMRLQTQRTDVDDAHRTRCRERLDFLAAQRADLAACFDRLVAGINAGTMTFKIYRQFKMYNDPSLNPYLSGRPSK